MDALTYIVALMTAIVFGWIGYFLGNLFPVFGKAKKQAESRKAAGESNPVTASISQSTKKVVDWLLEREEDPETPEEFSDHKEAESDAVSAEAKRIAATPPQVLDQVGSELLILWHGRKERKIFAQLKDDLVDLDDDLTPEQHGSLSMLLVDLQERVGLSATLRDAISERADKVLKEHARSQRLPPKEQEVKSPSFNPIKSLVNYVQADIPKIDTTASIPDQINTYLQEIIKGTPLDGRGVSMAEWPNRGTVFIVGVDVYEDIHKIPDAEIRQAIRRAVEQWEKGQDERWGEEGS
jgi:hypothetical protein